jgi:hypothetical protein
VIEKDAFEPVPFNPYRTTNEKHSRFVKWNSWSKEVSTDGENEEKEKYLTVRIYWPIPYVTKDRS